MLDKEKTFWYYNPCSAGLAHLVERHLAKVEVASSSLVARSIKKDILLDVLFSCSKQKGCETSPQPLKNQLKHVVIRTDVLIVTVFHAETAGDDAQLGKPQSLIEMSCVDVGRNHGVELQNRETMLFSLYQRIQNQLFSDMEPPQSGAYCIAGVADVAAAPYIVGVQDVKAEKSACVRIFRNSAAALRGKENPTCLVSQKLLLREGNALLYDFIPDFNHFRKVLVGIAANHEFHKNHTFCLDVVTV